MIAEKDEKYGWQTVRQSRQCSRKGTSMAELYGAENDL